MVSNSASNNNINFAIAITAVSFKTDSRLPGPISTSDVSKSYGPSPEFISLFTRWNEMQEKENSPFLNDSLLLQIRPFHISAVEPSLSEPRIHGSETPDERHLYCQTVQAQSLEKKLTGLHQQQKVTNPTALSGNPLHRMELPMKPSPQTKDRSGEDGDTECIDYNTHYGGRIKAHLFNAGCPEILDLVTEGKMAYQSTLNDYEDDGYCREMTMFLELRRKFTPVFIHQNNRCGWWLIPTTDSPKHPTALIAYLMWLMETRWTIIGTVKGSETGSLLVHGELSTEELCELRKGTFIVTLALFGIRGLCEQHAPSPQPEEIHEEELSFLPYLHEYSTVNAKGARVSPQGNNSIPVNHIVGKPGSSVHEVQNDQEIKKKRVYRKKETVVVKEKTPSQAEKELPQTGKKRAYRKKETAVLKERKPRQALKELTQTGKVPGVQRGPKLKDKDVPMPDPTSIIPPTTLGFDGVNNINPNEEALTQA